MKRGWKISLLALLAAALLLALSGLLLLRSNWLRERVRAAIVTTVEKAANARVEIGAFEYDWSRMSARVAPFVLHGTETDAQPPLFRADSVSLRFTVLSLVSKQVRLDSLTIEKPQVHISVDAQGRTNLPPRPPGAPDRNPIEELLRIAIRRLEIRNGLFEFDRRSLPVHVLANYFEAMLDWDSRGPLYRGRVSAPSIRMNGQIEASLDTAVLIEAGQLRFETARIGHGASSITASGSVRDWKQPVLQASFEGQILLADVPVAGLPSGRLSLSRGRAEWSHPSGWSIAGAADATELAFQRGDFRLAGVRARTFFRATPGGLEANGLNVDLLGGAIRGGLSLRRWKDFEVVGDASDLSVERLQGLFQKPITAWNGTISGPVSATGQLTNSGLVNLEVHGNAAVSPAEGALPLTGNIDFALSQASGAVTLGASHLETPGVALDFGGTLGDSLDFALTVTQLDRLEPVVGLVHSGSAVKIPARLNQGEVRLAGKVMGGWTAPRIHARMRARGVVVGDVELDRVEADVHAAPDRISVLNAHVFRQGERGRGEAEFALSDWAWSETLPLKARVELEQADLARLCKLAGFAHPPEGLLSGQATWSGTLDKPRIGLDINAGNLRWRGELVRLAELKLNYGDSGEGRLKGSVRLDRATAEIEGAYQHPAGRFDQGTAAVTVEAKNLSLEDIESIQALRPGLTGYADWSAKARVEVVAWRPSLRALEGALQLREVAQASGPIGSLELNAWTESDLMRFQARADLQGRPIQGVGQVRLTGDYPAQAKLIVPPMPFTLLRNLLAREPPSARPPVQGVVEGEINVQTPLASPDRLTGRAVLSRLVVRPREASLGETALDVSELTLRNTGPLVFDIDPKGIHVKSARFTAQETDLALSGDFKFNDPAPWNLSAQGAVNLAVISTFRPELQASGASMLNATFRGALEDPQLGGRLEIRQASLFLRNVPNGVEQAYGTVLFDRNRANIERLTGQTGGGSFDVSGFIGFGSPEFTYRLLAHLNKVRVRYPEGVSTTLNAAISLTGSSVRSLLSGTITVLRSGFNVQSDLATLIAQSSQPNTAAAVQNEFLQGMQFDVRVRTSANAEFQTSYTRDVQTEADLRLRGSLAKPILLGRVKINQGEVDFLGTRYTISRGEIIFYNTTSLQPAVDLDLETRVRGINVLVNFGGPINKLNVSYRSDPPLRSNEILALLAVGRTPESTQTSLGTSQTLQNQSNLPGSGGALLGGALSASVNGRLERFFGASRIKIDPTITGVDNIPQARLTLEQSVSRNITVTFVTNLNRTQQQIWRVEWDLSREWSVIAVRDENGLFGVDFLVRKRFK